MQRSERISLNVIAWESTVRLVQGVLQEGVNVKEVSMCAGFSADSKGNAEKQDFSG